MRTRHMVLLASFLILSSCSTHYYRVKDDALYIHLTMPQAREVYFASSLDGYRLHKAKKIDNKRWVVKVPASVEFRYFYIVDGKVFLPDCALKEADDFGSKNCIYQKGM